MIKTRRRDVLRDIGLGSCAPLLGPFVRRALADAAGTEPQVRRLVVFLGGNGIEKPVYQPSGADLSTGQLPAVFAPLEPWRRELTVLDAFYNPHNVETHGNRWATMSVRPSAPAPDGGGGGLFPTPSGQTFDRYVAAQIGARDALTSINLSLGVGQGGDKLLQHSHLSADGPGRPFPALVDPVAAYRAIFGGAAPTPSVGRAAFAERKSVLDGVREDITRLRGRLAGAERAKLDQLTDSLSALERQLALTSESALSCRSGPEPLDPRLPAAVSESKAGPVVPERGMAHVSLIFNAFLCGRTRVATLNFFPPSSSNTYDFLLGKPAGKHGLSHQGNHALLTKIDAWHLQHAAALWQRLKATPEGGGTMADRTLMLFVNAGGGVHHNGAKDHPVFLLGSLSGRLRAGRYHAFPRLARCLSDVYVTCAQALGIETNTFGTPEHCKGALPGVIA